MATTVNFNIDYTDLSEVRLSFSAEEASVIRYVEVAGTDLSLFMDAMLGWSTLSGGSNLIRYVPEAHPHFTRLYATSVEHVDPLGLPSLSTLSSGEGTGLLFASMKLAVTYRTRDYQIKKDSEISTELDRYVMKVKNFSIESIQYPSKGFQFTSDSAAIPENPTVLFPTADLMYTWYQVPAQKDVSTGEEKLPTALDTNITATVGRVNSVSFEGHAAETLLCLPPDIVPVRQPDQTRAFNITYKFAVREADSATWNKIWRSKTGSGTTGFAAVRRVEETSKGIYTTAPFASLFSLT